MVEGEYRLYEMADPGNCYKVRLILNQLHIVYERVPVNPRGYAALDVMETHLADHRYFSAQHYGIADIALYAYTHVAHEGGYNLAEYRNIKSWLTRVASQPRHIGIGD